VDVDRLGDVLVGIIRFAVWRIPTLAGAYKSLVLVRLSARGWRWKEFLGQRDCPRQGTAVLKSGPGPGLLTYIREVPLTQRALTSTTAPFATSPSCLRGCFRDLDDEEQRVRFSAEPGIWGKGPRYRSQSKAR
jgi:hypothetical protein